MSLSKGSLNIAEVYKGSLPIAEIYKGSSLVWKKVKDFKLSLFLDLGSYSITPKDIFVSEDGYAFVPCSDGTLKVYDIEDGELKNSFNFKDSNSVGTGNTISNWCNTVVGDRNYLYLNDHNSDKVFVLSYNGYNITFNRLYNSGAKFIYSSCLYNGYLYMTASESGKQGVLKMNVSDGSVNSVKSYPSSTDKYDGMLDVDENTGNIFYLYDTGANTTQYVSTDESKIIKLAPDGTELNSVNIVNNQNLDNSLNNVYWLCLAGDHIYTTQKTYKAFGSPTYIRDFPIWTGGTDIYDKNLNIVLKDTPSNEPYLHSGRYMNFEKMRFDKKTNSILCFDVWNNSNIYSLPLYHFNS